MGDADSVYGYLKKLCHENTEGYTIEDLSLGMVRFKNGSAASITGCNCAVKDRFMADFRIVFENAVLDLSSPGDWRVKDKAVLYFDAKEEEIIEDENPYLKESQDFIKAVLNKEKARTPVAQGLKTINLIKAVMKSAETKGGQNV